MCSHNRLHRTISRDEFRRLIAELGDSDARIRGSAQHALEGLSEAAIGDIAREMLASPSTTPEQQLRLQAIVDSLKSDPKPEEWLTQFDQRYIFGKAFLLSRLDDGSAYFAVDNVYDRTTKKLFDQALVKLSPTDGLSVQPMAPEVNGRLMAEQNWVWPLETARGPDGAVWMGQHYRLNKDGTFSRFADDVPEYKAIRGPDAAGRMYILRQDNKWLMYQPARDTTIANLNANPFRPPADAALGITDPRAIAALKLVTAKQEVGPEMMDQGDFVDVVKSVADAAPLVEPGRTFGTCTWRDFKFNVGGGGADCFRFRTPKENVGNLNWAFTLNDSFGKNWYILKRQGDIAQGFTRFNRLDPGDFKNVNAPARSALYTQGLSEQFLEPDSEYIIWFRFQEGVTDVQPMRVALNLITTEAAAAANAKPAEDAGELPYFVEDALGLVKK